MTDEKLIQLVHYDQLKEKKAEFRYSESDSPLDYFGPIGDINIFVGANNSRKSRFLRELLKKEKYVLTSNKISEKIERIEAEVNNIIKKFPKNKWYSIVETTGKYGDPEVEAIASMINPIISDFRNQTAIDGNFYANFLSDLKKQYRSTSDNESFETFKIFLLKYRNFFGFLLFYKYLDSQDPLAPINIAATKEGFKFGDYLNDESPDTIKMQLRKYISVKYSLGNSEIVEELDKIERLLSEILDDNWEFSRPFLKFIPTLRTAISLYNPEGQKIENHIDKNFYLSTIRKHYSISKLKEKKIDIFTGIDLYQRIKKDRNSRREIRDRFEAFESFLKEKFFEGKGIDIIATVEDTEEKEHIQIYIDGEDDRHLHDLGDGIQALIILMYPIFMAEKGSWIFIEEPELNMHPGLQHLFLKAITSDKKIIEKNLTFFISTHSNHLLNLSLAHPDRIAIFSFEKVSQHNQHYSKIRKVIGCDINVLDLLGVYNASVFMANCSIWVEGITDRRYIQAYLKAYIRDMKKTEFIEDYHYSFFEYAGSNLMHYKFSDEENPDNDLEKIKAHFLANRIFLLADQDKSESKERFHKEIGSWQSDNFIYRTTQAIEIENLISPEVLKLFLKDSLKIDPEIVDDLHFTEEDYKDERLAAFLKKKFGNKKTLSLPSGLQDDANKSGTLSTYYKNKLSQFVADKINVGDISWEKISQNKAASQVITEIYEFIKKHNPHFGC